MGSGYRIIRNDLCSAFPLGLTTEMTDIRNWVVALVVCVFFVGFGFAQYKYATEVIALQKNICTVIGASEASSVQQEAFYSAAATRARKRAEIDTGSLRQSDLDAAQQDEHIAEQYARNAHFNFPGCPVTHP